MATELKNPERSVFIKEPNTQNFWAFELAVQEINIPVWVYIVFQQSDRHDQNLNNDIFTECP